MSVAVGDANPDQAQYLLTATRDFTKKASFEPVQLRRKRGASFVPI